MQQEQYILALSYNVYLNCVHNGDMIAYLCDVGAYPDYLKYHINIRKVDKWLDELLELVKNNKDIQDFFNEFGVDIVDKLKPGNRPTNFFSEDIDKIGARGGYNLFYNFIGYGRLALRSKHIFMSTFIHEMAHWAEDKGKLFGRLQPNITLPTFALWVQGEINKDGEGPYGYAAEMILFGKIY